MTDNKLQKSKQERPYAKPEAAARNGRQGSVDEYAAGRDQAIADGLLVMHECGGFVMFTAAGAAED
jgi:hypothetical protein